MTPDMTRINVYISYAWGQTSSGDESLRFIADLQASFNRKGINILIDKEEIAYKKSIKEFMDRLSHGKYVIMIITDKYLKSKSCMYEALQILKNDSYYDSIFPIIFKGAKIYDPTDILEYIK